MVDFLSDEAIERRSWLNWDDRRFVTLTTSKDPEILKRLAIELEKRLWPDAPPYSHDDDVIVVLNKDSQIAVLLDTWRAIGKENRLRISIYADAYVEGAEG